MTEARVAGAVLAGGASQRFGRDKAMVLYKGESLLDRSIAALGPYAEVIFVAGRDHPGHQRSVDRPMTGLGPLGGLCGALAVAREAGFTHLLSAPCDTPVIPRQLLDDLTRETGGAFIASCPVIGFWPTMFADHLSDHLLGGGDRAVRSWARLIGARPLAWDEPLLNINQPSDIAHGD